MTGPQTAGALVLLEEDLRAFVADMANGLFRKAAMDAWSIARNAAALLAPGRGGRPDHEALVQALAQRGVAPAALEAFGRLRDLSRRAATDGLSPVSRDEAIAAGNRAENLLTDFLARAEPAVRRCDGWPAVEAALLGFRILLGRPQPIPA